MRLSSKGSLFYYQHFAALGARRALGAERYSYNYQYFPFYFCIKQLLKGEALGQLRSLNFSNIKTHYHVTKI